MKHYSIETGPMVCSRAIDFDIDGNDCLHNVKFHGGCPGNLTAIAKLTEGMKVDDAINIFNGIRCGSKPTSCTDQFARILKKVKQK